MTDDERTEAIFQRWDPLLKKLATGASVPDPLTSLLSRLGVRACCWAQPDAKALLAIVSEMQEALKDIAADRAAVRAEVLEGAAKIAEQPTGHYEIGRERQPYWDGELIAGKIRALAAEIQEGK